MMCLCIHAEGLRFRYQCVQEVRAAVFDVALWLMLLGCRALKLDPSHGMIRQGLGVALSLKSKAFVASEDGACPQFPAHGDLTTLVDLLSLPESFASSDDLKTSLFRLKCATAHLLSNEFTFSPPPADVLAWLSRQAFPHGFLLSYAGVNDKELRAAIASVYEKAIPSLRWTAPHLEKAGPFKTKSSYYFFNSNSADSRVHKLRVGFVAASLTPSHSLGKLLGKVILQLACHEDVELTLFVLQPPTWHPQPTCSSRGACACLAGWGRRRQHFL
jgi:hypothetical protein